MRKPSLAIDGESARGPVAKRLLPLRSSSAHEVYTVASVRHAALCGVDMCDTKFVFAQSHSL